MNRDGKNNEKKDQVKGEEKGQKKLLRRRLNDARSQIVKAQQNLYEVQQQVGADKGKDLELPLSTLQRVLATVHLVAEREGVKLKVKKEKAV